MTETTDMTVLAPRKPRRLPVDRVSLVAVAIFALFLAAWEYVLVPATGISPALLPTPTQIARALYIGFTEGSLLADTGITLHEVVVGYALGAAVGFILAIPVAESRAIERVMSPYVVALQAIPKVAIAPLFVVWFGFGMTAKVVIVALITFFPVFVNAVAGLRATSAELHELFDVYSASRYLRFRHLKLQNAAPYLFAGLNVGITLSVIGAIVAEFVGAQEGLGSAIMRAGFALDTAGVFAAVTVLTVIAAGASAIVQAIGRKVVFWIAARH
jgi:NitT/TauT family transport system permease protein